MQIFKNVKSIEGKITFHGIGPINMDGAEQSYILTHTGLLKGKVNDNMVYHKKVFRMNEDGTYQFKHKVSANCIRHNMFRESMPFHNSQILSLPQVLFNAIATPDYIIRGYMFAEEQGSVIK